MKPVRNYRLYFFVLCLIAVTGGISYRIFTLTVIRHAAFAQSSQSQQAGLSSALVGRGSIYAQNHTGEEKKLLATNHKTEEGTERVYPQGLFAGQLLGFVGFQGHDRVGQYGIERSYHESLQENDILLTIDPTIQSYVETSLSNVIKKWSAQGGSIIVQEPYSGAILAMASSPSFDPNNYSRYDFDNFLNPAVQEQFEPGSSFKPVTMAAALDSKSVTPYTTYEDSGAVTIGSYTIKNFDEKTHGLQTMRQVLEKSLNTGTIFAQRKTGDDEFLNYIVGFGFGQKTGVDLPGEILGTVANLYQGRAINFATASFGQGIAVTPIQLISAYSAIANGGKLMRPFVVKKILHADGSVAETKPKVLGAPINEKTSAQLVAMLTSVVDRGFDKARIAGYDVAGKTGTAQIPDKDGGYLEDKQFIHNFVGFAPSYEPRFVVLIKMDRPQGITFAADSLSPVFGDLAGFLIKYFKIPPTR